MATSSPKAAKSATPKTPAPAAAKKASAAKPAHKTAAAAPPAEPVAATAAPSAVVAPAAKKAPKAAAKTPVKAASKPAGQPTLKQAAAKAAPAVSAAPEPAPAKKAAAKTAAKKAANQAGQLAATVVPVAEPVAEPAAAPRAAARKTRAASAEPQAAAAAQVAETAAAAKPKAAPKPTGKVAGKTAARTAGKSAGKTAGKTATKKAAAEAPANTPTPAVDVAGSVVAAAAPKAPPRPAAKRAAKSAAAEAVAPAPAVAPPAPQPVNEPEAPQADAAIASAADAPAADAPAPAEPPQGGARTGGRSRGERGGRGRRDGRGERDNRDAAAGRAAGDGSAGGTAGGGAEGGAAERNKPVGDAQGGERRDGRPAAGNRPRRPEPMSLDERAARSKQAMALAEAETANPTPAAPDAAEGEHAAPSPAEAPSEQRDNRDRERGQHRGRGRDRDRDRDRPSTPPPAGAPAADAEPTTAAPAAPATVYRLPAEPETAGADEAADAHDAPDASSAPDTPDVPAQAQRPARPRPSPSGPAHSALVVVETADQRHIAWQPGHTCPESLDDALHDRLDASGHLAPDDDGALPLLLRLAKDAGHSVQIDPALWPLLGANRDARTRLHVLEAAYPDGAASAGLATLLRAPLPAYQADGALFAVVAGRLLMADERGLGKGVQAMAAAELWHRHFGVQRVLVLCTGDQRLAWQRAWWRFAGRSAQLVEGNANARQALWGQDADLRILSPDVLASDATALANWSPELVIVDEPQRLDGGWRHLDTPLALVLCGAALDTQPDLLDALVAWLDDQRQGPLAAVRRIRAAHDSGEVLDDNAIEQISDTLSRVMLQRQRAEVAEQLPPRVLGVRQVPLAAPQREAHAAHLATVQRLVAGWRRSGYLSDSDQWRLGQALAAAQTACHRANPADAGSPLAEATVATLDAQLADWGDTGYPMVAVLCASPADRDQLAAHFGESPGLVLCLPGEPLPEGTEVVLRIGVPWRLKSGPRTLDAVPGMPWVHLVGQASLELGLADTLAQRADVPAGLAEAGGRGYLSGAKLDAWLHAIDAALAAMAPPVGAVSSA